MVGLCSSGWTLPGCREVVGCGGLQLLTGGVLVLAPKLGVLQLAPGGFRAGL